MEDLSKAGDYNEKIKKSDLLVRCHGCRCFEHNSFLKLSSFHRRSLPHQSQTITAEVFLTNHRQMSHIRSPIADVIFLLSITEIQYILKCLLKSAQVADVSIQAPGEEWRLGNR